MEVTRERTKLENANFRSSNKTKLNILENIIIAVELSVAFVYTWYAIKYFGCNDFDTSVIYNKALLQSKGYELYTEVTSFLPPLAYFPLNTLLKINNTFKTCQLLGMIQQILMVTLVTILAYKITHNKIISFTYSTIGYALITSSLLKTFNYNTQCTVFIIVIILVEISNISSRRKDILVGIMVALTCLTKHSIGFVSYIMSMATIIIYSIEQRRINRKSLLIRTLTPLSIGLIVGIKWVVCGQLYDAMDQIVIGMNNFAKNAVVYFDVVTTMTIIGNIGLVLYGILGTIKAIKEKDNTVKILLIYSIANISMIIPLLEFRHIVYGSTLISMISLYTIKYRTWKIKISEVLVALVMVFTLYVYSGAFMHNCTIEHCTFGEENPLYKGVIVEEETKAEINKVRTYIEKYKEEHEGEDCKIVVYSTKTALISPGENYYKYYDVPFRGNQGSRSLEEQAYDLIHWDNTIIIMQEKILDKQDQLSGEAMDIIRNNGTVIKDLGMHKVYKSNIVDD